MQEDLAPLWQSAQAEYEKDTKRQLSENTLTAVRGIRSTGDLLKQIESFGQDFQDFRNKRSRLWHTLSGFVLPITTILKIAIPPASVSDGFGIPASAAIGACLYLVKSCENVSQAYDWIEQVFTELQEFSERLDVYAQSKIDGVLRKKIVAILSFVMRVIGRSEILIREHRFRQYLRVTFLGKDASTKELVENLNKLFGSEQRFVLAVTYATVQRIEEKLDDKVAQIELDVKQVQASMKESQEREASVEDDERIRRALCNTTAAEDVEETFFRNKRNLLKGTGAWLRHEILFTSWLEHRATILWIFGLPGAGKSYLSTWLIKQMVEDLPEGQRKDMSVAYFFVKENSEALRDGNTILKTLAWQLTVQDSQFKQHAAKVSQQRALLITAEDTWENLFLGYYGNVELQPRFASIVIDGLDEATVETRRTLLGFMKELVSLSRSSARPALQFAVVGRTSLRNDVEFTRQEKTYYIEISKHKNKEDIDSYIRKRLEEVEVLQEMRKVKYGLKRANKTGAAIKSKILDGADGVFLWAKLLIDTILRKDLAQIESILKEPPASLDDMIWSVFERLTKDVELDHELLKRMLLLCGYAQRPLKFGELDLFLSLPTRKPNLLLWKQTRGKLSSIFEFKYPKGFDPDTEEDSEVDNAEDGKSIGNEIEQTGRMANEDESSNVGAFDFSGDVDDDSDDDLEPNRIDDLVFDPVVDHGLSGDSERKSTENTLRHLSDGQLKTEITFCHARIKDYIVREGSPRSRRKPICAIIPDANRVHVQYAITCLDIFQLELSLVRECRYLVDYSLQYLALHLEATDRALVSDEEFCQIARGLYWLFGTEKGAKCFIQANQDYDEFHSSHDVFYRTWVGTECYFRVVQHWFRDPRSRGNSMLGLDMAAESWIDGAADGYETLLEPLMRTASNLWLIKPGYDSPEYTDKGERLCLYLHGWLAMTEKDSVPQQVQKLDISNWGHSLEMLSAGRLESLATWAGLEHDTHWHTCLGWILMTGNHHAEAISHFEDSLAQDLHAWIAMEGMARCYGEQGEYQLAIDWQTKAIEDIPEKLNWLGAYLWPRIASWSSQLGNEDLAHEAAEHGFDTDWFSVDAQVSFLQTLHKRGSTDRILSTIKFLNEQMMDEGYSGLARLMIRGVDVFTEIGKACREHGQPAWVLDVMDEALTTVDRGDRPWIKVWLPYNMAKFRYEWYDGRDDETIKLAELFLDRLGRETASSQEGYVSSKRWVTNKLAQLYFDRATALFHSANGLPSEASVFADRLKSLAVIGDTSHAENWDGFDLFRDDYPALLWGRWLRDYKKADEKVWRKCFKVRLLEEMNSLDDDDPTNDMNGLRSLAISLFHAGNRRDAAAILAVLFSPLEEDRATKPDEQRHGGIDSIEPGKADDELIGAAQFDSELGQHDVQSDQQATPDKGEHISPIDRHISSTAKTVPEVPTRAIKSLRLHVTEEGTHFGCDNCERESKEVTELYFCEVCLDCNWCGECLAKLRDASIKPGLKYHSCNPNHAVYRAWPIPKDAKGSAAEYLEGGIELRREWLERLRDEWLKAGV